MNWNSMSAWSLTRALVALRKLFGTECSLGEGISSALGGLGQGFEEAEKTSEYRKDGEGTAANEKPFASICVQCHAVILQVVDVKCAFIVWMKSNGYDVWWYVFISHILHISHCACFNSEQLRLCSEAASHLASAQLTMGHYMLRRWTSWSWRGLSMWLG